MSSSSSGVPDGLEATADGPALIGWADLLSADDTSPDTVTGTTRTVEVGTMS